jgi:hypothetical protein
MKRPRPDRQRKVAQTPLQYMVSVMNDETASKERRDRMAVTAARYLHERPAGTGKKGATAEAAREAANGWDGDLASGDWRE